MAPLSKKLSTAGGKLARRRGWLIAAIAAAWLVIVTIVVVVLVRLPSERNEAEGQVEHTDMVLLSAEQLRSDLLTAETGQRSYLLVNDPAYSALSATGSGAAREQLAKLHQLTLGNPSQQKRLEKLDELVAARLAIIEQTFELARNGDLAGAIAIVRAGAGKNAMDGIRATLASLVAEEEQLLAERQAASAASERGTRTVLIVLGLATLLLLAALLAIATRSLLRRQRKDAAQERATILESIADGFMAMDAEWHLTYVNKAAEKLLGTSKEKLLGESHWELYPADQSSVIWREYHRTMLDRVPVMFENFYEPWQQWFEVRAYPADTGGIIVYFQDITERKRFRTSLRRSEARSRAAIEAVDGIVWTNNAAGKMTGEQPGWAALTGQTYEEYQGYGWSKAVHPDDAQRTIAAWNKAVADRDTFAFEHRVRRHDGVWRRFAVRAIPIVREDGTLREWVGVHTDITAQREAEDVLARDRDEMERLVEARTAALLREVEDRRRAEEALRQGEKLQAIGQLTGGIAHDFNNILQVVASGAHLLRQPKLSEDKRTLILDGLTKSAENAKALTSRLLSFARKQSLQPETFDVNARLAGMSELLRHTLGSHIRVETDFEDDLWPALADPNQLEVAILNLAVNARDAMLPDSGVLTLQTRPARLDATSERAAGDYICVAVKDSGSGMPPEVLAHVFEPFFTTKGPDKGTGLGLAQVYGFAKQSGGDVAIESEPGKGTTITLHLPRATEALAAALAHPQTSMQPSQQTIGRAVLVVDDNPDVAAFTASMLAGLGYTTRCVANAASVMGLLDAGEHVDAVFSDVVMPGDMNGVELASALRKQYPRLAIVLATGYSEVLAEWEGKAVAEVLGKPYRLEELAAALERAFSKQETPLQRAPIDTMEDVS